LLLLIHTSIAYTTKFNTAFDKMNKLGRLAEWGKEKMARDSKNTISEDYKALELEMTMRHEGIALASDPVVPFTPLR